MVSLMVCGFRQTNARFFVRTVAGELSTIILTDVRALNICGLRAGNIIFDLVLIAPGTTYVCSALALPGESEQSTSTAIPAHDFAFA